MVGKRGDEGFYEVSDGVEGLGRRFLEVRIRRERLRRGFVGVSFGKEGLGRRL